MTTYSKIKISIFVIIFVFGGGLLVNKSFVKWKNKHDESIRLDFQYTNFIDSCYRLRLDTPREIDVDRFFEQLFGIWLSSEESAKIIFQKNYAFSKNGKIMLLKRADARDFLNIKSFGNLLVEQDGGHVGFYIKNNNSSMIRLALFFKTLNSPLIGNDYDELNEQFFSQASYFLSSMRIAVQKN